MKAAILALATAGAIAAATWQDPPKPGPQDTLKQVVVVKAANVKWGDHPYVQGAKMCVESGDPAKGPAVVMMKFPKGITVPAHWHTSDETVTVVSGAATFGTGETIDASKGTEVGPGSYAIIPGKSPHWVITKEDFVITVTLDKPADFHLCGATEK